jgi:hypothetical protein
MSKSKKLKTLEKFAEQCEEIRAAAMAAGDPRTALAAIAECRSVLNDLEKALAESRAAGQGQRVSVSLRRGIENCRRPSREQPAKLIGEDNQDLKPSEIVQTGTEN